MIGKAEHLEKGSNPRFGVTSLPCGQVRRPGNMSGNTAVAETCRTASRTTVMSVHRSHKLSTVRANQLRLGFSTVACIPLRALREFALKRMPLDTAQATLSDCAQRRPKAMENEVAPKNWLSRRSVTRRRAPPANDGAWAAPNSAREVHPAFDRFASKIGALRC